MSHFDDRDLDSKVARTRERPLAAGTASVTGACVWLAAQLGVALGVLVQLNTPAILMGCASLIPVALYPLAKRVTMWPQAVLGLTFNWGVPMGYVAASGALDVSVVAPMYLSAVVGEPTKRAMHHTYALLTLSPPTHTHVGVDTHLRHNLCASGQARRRPGRC